MDRVNQLRTGGDGDRGGDATLDTSSPPSEAYMSANDTSSKYFSLSDSTFDISPIKDVSLASASAAEPDRTLTDPDELLSDLSPITKKDVMLDSFKIGKQIEAANILSGGVDIFDDNDNSFDGDELVIDDNVEIDDKESLDDKLPLDEIESEGTLVETHVDVTSKDTEVVLQIDGKNVDAIDIGNGLYLYRKAGQDELAAVQIITEEHEAPCFKFLKVRENVEGNLEVYEEFEIEVSKNVPVNDARLSAKKTSNVPIKSANKVRSESSKVFEKKDKTPPKEVCTSKVEVESEDTELNLIAKKMKFNESRKLPVVGTFTAMTYSSTPKKEGKPLTKTMVDQQLHPNRHSDNVKKTIEVHTDSQTKKLADEINKQKFDNQLKKELSGDSITKEISTGDKQIEKSIQNIGVQDKKDLKNEIVSSSSNAGQMINVEHQNIATVSSGEQSTMKLSDITTIKPPNDKKPHVKPDAFTTPEVQNKKADMALETEESIANTIKPSKTSILIVSKTNQISKSNNDKTKDISDDISDKNNTCNVSSRDDSKNVLNEDLNLTVGKSSEPKINKVDQNQETSKDVEQNVKVKSDKKLQETPHNQNKEETKPNVAIPQKESTEAINDDTSSLSSCKQTKTTNEIQDNSKTDSKELVEEVKILAVSNIPTATEQVKDNKMQTNVSEKLEETKQKTLDTEKSSLGKTTSSDTEEKANKTNSVASDGNSTKLSVDTEKPEVISPTENIIKVESKIEPKVLTKPAILNPSKKEVTDIKSGVNTEVRKDIAVKTDLRTDNLYLVAKSVGKTTLLETEKIPVSKVVAKASNPTPETKVLENKVETKTVSQTTKLISAVKKVDNKTFSKAVSFNPVEKKIEPAAAAALKNIQMASDVKINEPKTYPKTENTNQFPKTPEANIASKPELTVPATKTFELKTVPKTVLLHPKGIELKTSKVEKVVPVTQQIPRSNAVIITSNKIYAPSKASVETKLPDASSDSDRKLINNNHAAVPFGKWTDANRQEFLNKFKEIKVPATSTSKQIKNSNDLNRIDVLKKIDSQRSNTASAKALDKSNVKDTVFSSKIAQPKVQTKIPVKNEGLKMKAKLVETKICSKPDGASEKVSSTATNISNVGTSVVATVEQEERREVNVNDLIGRAIVDMLNRPVPMPMTRSPLDEPRHADNKDTHATQAEATTDSQNLDMDQQKQKTDQQKVNADQPKLNIDQQKMTIDQQKLNVDQQKIKIDEGKLNSDQQKLNIEQKIDEDSSGSLDDIEMKMNELHGIPFVERPPHELPRVYKTYGKSSKDKAKGAKKLVPAPSKQPSTRDNVIHLKSEKVIEHEPVTGDKGSSKRLTSQIPLLAAAHVTASESKEPQKEDAVINENDFDKFACRNSNTFENCLTVKFDGKEPGNVVQTVKEKDAIKMHPKNEICRTEALKILPHKHTSSQTHASKALNTKFGPVPEDPNSKNQQSKIHTAYQSLLTTKRQVDHPITIIKDKPVKVVFMDANPEFIPNQLNVQGKELSPAKKAETATVSPQAVSSDVTDALEDKQDDVKAKTKHQRKQVLTPVEAPDLELIQPHNLGLDVSPKKKRKTDESKTEKNLKNLVHKKSYLLGRAAANDKAPPHEMMNVVKETMTHAETVVERTASAIDSLVKAAELLDNQSVDSASSSQDSQNTPVKRGRGRPRKYPLPEGVSYTKVVSPSPQKKPRLIDAKPVIQDSMSDEGSSDDEQIIRENWTMGKINENIVCPICNKLFRSENVVFKHVKHCTGVSPTRSDLERRRRGYSRESDNKSFDSQLDDMEFDEQPKESIKSTPKRKSKEPVSKPDEVEVIVIEDTPVKEQEIEKESKIKIQDEKKNPKPVQEPANESTVETQEKAQKVDQDKSQKVEEENSVKEKTLKEIADEKLAKAKKLEEVHEEKTVKPNKGKTVVQRSSNLVCEFCGKTFRQLSYLVSHKLQHKKEQLKKLEAKLTAKLQVFSCEVCNKHFKKMHHLLQHRIIHDPEAPTRTTRKSSSEQSEAKAKEQPAAKQNDDTSAGFRCEPCDKSFRKLHHLVEHRETHDGINRQKTNAQAVTSTIEKPPPPPQCDVCKKSFRKLHHLIEHKEQHHVEHVERGETSSDKSDDKSVQSSLSTRDIIHECSLCYMVFPNEHSLNKHFVICQQKKKRQSKAKLKPENVDGDNIVEEVINAEDSMVVDDEPKIVAEQIIEDDKVESAQESKTAVLEKIEEKTVKEKSMDTVRTLREDKRVDVTETPVPKEEVKALKCEPAKPGLPIIVDSPDEKQVTPTPEKTKKVEQQVKVLPKKTPIKDKVPPSVTKRQKSFAPLPIVLEGKPVETSDDDDVRYMLNPDFKADETTEGKVFMKVRSNKRSSLQIERPSSRDLINRRTSLQHPPKIPRLKAKAFEPKIVPKTVPKPLKVEAASTDSDDSDVKYSFPATVTEQVSKTEGTPKGKKLPRKSLAEKRKSLGGIAKRKSLGQASAKLKANSTPNRIIKRRTLGVEHRCDCGQLFNSAALLTRHTSLAHTPPRIRRRRSPPPEPTTKHKPTPRTEPKPTRNSTKSDTPETRKSIKPEQSADKSAAKPKRTGAHRGVPVPEKMRKLMMKIGK